MLLGEQKKNCEPIIIEEAYFGDLNETLDQVVVQDDHQVVFHPKQRSCHLFVFVHGFQANAIDMSAFRNLVWKLLPNVSCLISRSNEANTDTSIQQMGLNLANEVKQFL